MSIIKIKELIQSSIEVKQSLLQNEALVKQIDTVVEVVTKAFENGNSVYFAGNGGSAQTHNI
jgi:D-sedoheptulose 7-phosphate isomerase